MNIYEQLGKTVCRLRSERKLSQESLAINAVISPRYMSDIENGKRQLSLDVVEKVSKAFGLTLSELFAEVEKTKNND